MNDFVLPLFHPPTPEFIVPLARSQPFHFRIIILLRPWIIPPGRSARVTRCVNSTAGTKMSAFKSISEGFQTLYVELRNDLVRDGLQDSKIADGMQHLQKVR